MRQYLTQEQFAKRVARMLVEAEAVQYYGGDSPFRLSSGIASPVYVDCRKLLFYPLMRRDVIEMMASQLFDSSGYRDIQIIAGGETAGIPFAAWLAERMNLPMVYVRKRPQDHGSLSHIEGGSVRGKKVLLVEDLTTDGKSKARFCDVIRNAGGIVERCSVVFFYNMAAFDYDQVMRDSGIRLNYLCSWNELLHQMHINVDLPRPAIDDIAAFIADPLRWSERYV